MRYDRLGDSGLLVSRMAFGSMTMGSGMTPALAAGINFFDTANVYHAEESERILGAALGPRRKEAVIATKVSMRLSDRLDDAGLSARHIYQSVDDSLSRLGTDFVDCPLLSSCRSDHASRENVAGY